MTAFFVRCGKIVKHAYLIFTKKKKLPAYRAKSISPFNLFVQGRKKI